MKRYKQAYDDEWFEPIKTGYKMRCCDCGLVHVFNFRVVKGTTTIQITAKRDNRATAASRRSKKYKKKIPTLLKTK